MRLHKLCFYISKKAFTTEYLYIKLALDFMNYNYALLFRLFNRWAARLLQLIFYKKKKKNHYVSHKRRQKRKKFDVSYKYNHQIKSSTYIANKEWIQTISGQTMKVNQHNASYERTKAISPIIHTF